MKVVSAVSAVECCIENGQSGQAAQHCSNSCGTYHAFIPESRPLKNCSTIINSHDLDLYNKKLVRAVSGGNFHCGQMLADRLVAGGVSRAALPLADAAEPPRRAARQQTLP